MTDLDNLEELLGEAGVAYTSLEEAEGNTYLYIEDIRWGGAWCSRAFCFDPAGRILGINEKDYTGNYFIK